MSDGCCDDDKVERESPEIDGAGVVVPGGGETRLQTAFNDVPKITARHETDSHTAITRGLAEYIASLRYSHRGSDVSAARVVYDYPDREDAGEPVFPAASVYGGTEEGTYSDQNSAPISKDEIVGTEEEGRVALVAHQIDVLTETLHIEVECQGVEQRIGVRKMLEAAFRPLEWTSGFKLILPHYHSALGIYSLVGAAMVDTPENVAMGIRVLSMTVQAWVCTYELRRLPVLVQVQRKSTIRS